MNKEQIYDEKIEPLMAQIIAVCRANKIAMLATFAIPTEENSSLCCTTYLPDETGELPDFIRDAAQIIRPTGGGVMLTERDASGEVTKMTAILP